MKNFQAIVLLFLANTISGVAQGISMIAIPWHFSQNEDMTRFGVVYGISSLISLFWVPYSGTLVDRFNRKNIFLVITGISGAVVLGVASWGINQGTLGWWMIASVFLVTFSIYNIHFPNLYAFMQEITERKYYGKISSYLEVFNQLAAALAGAFAALLLSGVDLGQSPFLGLPIKSPIQINAWSIQEIFLMDGITYIISFLIISRIRFIPLTTRSTENVKLWTRIKTGWNWLQEHKKIFQFGVSSYFLFGTVMLVSFYLCASYVKLHLDMEGDTYATAEMFYSLGALCAGLSIRYIFRNNKTALNIAILTFINASFYITLYFFQSASLLFVSMIILGLTNAGTRILRVSYLFETVPNQFYGRVNVVFFLSLLVFRSLLIAAFALPFFQTSERFASSYLIMGAILVLACMKLISLSPHIQMNKKQS